MNNQNKNVYLPLYEYFPEDPERFRLKLKDVYENIAIQVNRKDSGLYELVEIMTGKKYFNASLSSGIGRDIFRRVIDFGALPNATTKTVAHGLSVIPGTIFTMIYGAATDPSTSYIPLPYASPTAANAIELSVDATNVTVTTAIDYSGYTICYIVLEYIQNST